MDISKIIQDLLIKNDTASVPGLGTFSLKYIPSEFYKFSNQVSPPSHQLVFTETADVSDNSLVNALSKKMNFSEKEAQKEIENWVKEIIIVIDKGTFQIDKVGTLKKENNTIVFEADRESPIFADNFGLEITRMPLIEIEGEIIKEPIPYKPIYNPVPVKKSNWVNRILIIAIIILIGAGIFMLYQMGYLQPGMTKILSIFRKESGISNTQLATNDTLSGKIDANTLKRNALRYNENYLKSKNDTLNTTQKTSQKVIRYYLIAGSFKTMNRAEILKGELQVKGFTPEILVVGDTTFRVSMASYIIRRKAVDEFIRLTSNEYNYKLWLFSQLTQD
jgi:hypothetical protein